MLERDIQKAVVDYARSKGMIAVKQGSGMYGTVGWPDYLFVMPKGRCFWIEFKTTTGVTSPSQDSRIEQLKEFGHHVFVVREKQLGRSIVDLMIETLK